MNPVPDKDIGFPFSSASTLMKTMDFTTCACAMSRQEHPAKELALPFSCGKKLSVFHRKHKACGRKNASLALPLIRGFWLGFYTALKPHGCFGSNPCCRLADGCGAASERKILDEAQVSTGICLSEM